MIAIIAINEMNDMEMGLSCFIGDHGATTKDAILTMLLQKIPGASCGDVLSQHLKRKVIAGSAIILTLEKSPRTASYSV